MLLQNILTLGFASLASAVLIESKAIAPVPWNMTNKNPPQTMRLPLTIVLHQEDPDGFVPIVLNNKRVSREEAAVLRKASNESVYLVSEWLEDKEIEYEYDGRDLIRFNTTVEQSELLLNMKLHRYGYRGSNDTVLRTLAYHVPDSLGDHIDFIHPLLNFMAPKRDPLQEHINMWTRERIERKGLSEPIPHRWHLRKEQLRKDWWAKLRKFYDQQKEPDKIDWGAKPYWDTDADQVDPIESNANSTEEERIEFEEMAKQIEDSGKSLYRPKKGNTGGLCRADVLPDCIREQYEMPALEAGIGFPPIEKLGIAGNRAVSPSYADLTLFSYKHMSQLPEGDMRKLVKTEIYQGGKHHPPPKIGGIESAIDFQYGYGLAHPHEVINYASSQTMRQSNDNEPFLDLLDYLLDQPDDNLPSVLAVPYAEAELIVPRRYAGRVCRYFGLLSARGVSVIAASGDGGATGATSSVDQCANYGFNVIMASFPATCPWVTAVGAVNTEDNLYPSITSGGGFSEYFARPFWQENVIKDYQSRLDNHFKKPNPEYNPPLDHYQNVMRGTPDISAIGKRFQPAHNGKVSDWGYSTHHQWREHHRGMHTTMGSTMIVAAMTLHENARRTQIGLPTVGWLNRRLYEDVDGKYIYDVYKLITWTCTRQWNDKYWGWLALPGWDAATGLGAPKGMAIFNQI